MTILEPYYLKVEWAFGVSGAARRQQVRGPGARAAIRARRCRCRAMRRNSCKGCDALGWNAFPTPQAALSRPFNGRKATVVSAFAQQHGDPTGTRSSALNVFIPDAVATGNFELRPTASFANSCSTARAR